jgi:hypothetical protein
MHTDATLVAFFAHARLRDDVPSQQPIVLQLFFSETFASSS